MIVSFGHIETIVLQVCDDFHDTYEAAQLYYSIGVFFNVKRSPCNASAPAGLALLHTDFTGVGFVEWAALKHAPIASGSESD